ncbi:hypothetical protein POPTR_005G079500v4 [Populus trichocarpa]|jgi:hypothetical protein|uniref:FAS1 domain-containing protein n=1 Tax=Populus trichocarpa TaxID=3694 RepID=B9H565_POPTR|nr:fasciclin-like arabinogalactan protein 21 [Populus trichocarpa]KAI5587986.1 hypothetical protein BDE02_05G065700 [Populus trichocarpa]PNT35507.1 hypothetical protein POPTR_005G079500v4 [Populus trichocarpa]|eukprot:XP_002306324.1 fasciclin-like arabinogalactan protein 21 [Populus trichocarpa]
MESSPKLSILLILSLYIIISSTSIDGVETTTFSSNLSPQSPQPQISTSDHFHDHSFSSHTNLLAPILSHLGFTQLAMAVPSLPADSTTTAWSGPSTLFAPSDSSLRTCFSCSIPDLLHEHIVPGLFSIDYLRKLAFGTKIETLSPGRCITVTSTSLKNDSATPSTVKVFIGGVEITHPDLFNNGVLIIHGIQGYIAPLSPFSCDFERLSSLSFPFQEGVTPHVTSTTHQQGIGTLVQPAIMRLMLRDAMLRLRSNGFTILSLAMRVKYPELTNLVNMTVFALDDVSIFSGSHGYISSVRFHIVPNHYLSTADLERLPVGATLPTLERGQALVVTSAGGLTGFNTAVPMRINYVRVKVPDVMRNLKIVVHAVYLPFPRIHPTSAAAFDEMMGIGGEGQNIVAAEDGACSAVFEEDGSCGTVPPMPAQVKPSVVVRSDEDHHGL